MTKLTWTCREARVYTASTFELREFYNTKGSWVVLYDGETNLGSYTNFDDAAEAAEQWAEINTWPGN